MGSRSCGGLVPSVSTPSAGATSSVRAVAGQAGFTLVEILIGIAVLSAVMLAVATVSFSGALAISDGGAERHTDSTSAQFVSVAFGRDVQGAAGVVTSDCGASEGSELVTVRASSDGSLVSYRSRAEADTFALVRVECTSAGARVNSSTIAADLAEVPRARCAPTACTGAAVAPRTVTLEVTRTDRYTFSVAGARRTTVEGPIGPAVPAQLFAIGGSNPLTVQGNGRLEVVGNAFVNSAAANAVAMNGRNSRLSVTGQFRIRAGGGCSGCDATNVAPFPPGSFPAALPDPLAYLPAPDEAGLSAGSCNSNNCRPGIFAERLTLTGGATLQPGVYVLRKGIEISGNGTLNAQGVFLFNGCGRNAPPGCSGNQGSFAISGQAAANFSPMTTGNYAGILLYQARSNSSALSISGGSNLMLFSGALYAPSSTQVSLGAGGGGLRLGAVIARSMLVAGNGTVQVNGS